MSGGKQMPTKAIRVADDQLNRLKLVSHMQPPTTIRIMSHICAASPHLSTEWTHWSRAATDQLSEAGRCLQFLMQSGRNLSVTYFGLVFGIWMPCYHFRTSLTSQDDQCVYWMVSVLPVAPWDLSTVYLGSWLEFEPGVDDGKDREDRGGQATGPNKAWPCGVNPEPVQRDEDITAVLQQVQEQRRIAVQHSHYQVELSAEPNRHSR